VNTDLDIVVWLLPFLLVSLVLHELAHAYVATWLGDPSPRADGRLSFNPIVHLDPLGSAMFVITALFSPFIFGWAKPVMVRPGFFRRPQLDMALVAAAGPATNLLLALGCVAWLIHGDPRGTFEEVLIRAFEVNVVLGIFNLIPIPPLDGSRIVAAVMPRALHARWAQLDQVGMIALFAVIFVFNDQFWSVFSDILDETTRVMVSIVNV
jgi:Zn-dependent protease